MTSDSEIDPAASCYYDRLGLHHGAEPSEVERQWQLALSRYHYDSGGTETAFNRLRTAYDTLSDPDDRRAYDSIRESFDRQRAPALLEEWVVSGRPGDPVHYYRCGAGDVDAASRRRRRDGSGDDATSGDDSEIDDGSTDDGHDTGGSAARDVWWFTGSDVVESVVGPAFLVWTLQAMGAVLIARAGRHAVETTPPGESAWIPIGLCVSFAVPYVIRVASGRRVRRPRLPRAVHGIWRVASAGVVGVATVAVGAATAGLPFMGLGFVAFVAITVSVVGLLFALLGAVTGHPGGGFVVGGLAGLAGMLFVPPRSPDSFQAAMYSGGIYPYPFVPPLRLAVLNVGFLLNLLAVLSGTAVLAYACWCAAGTVLRNVSPPTRGSTGGSTPVWTVVPAVPTTLLFDAGLSGESPRSVFGRLASVFGPEITTAETVCLAVCVFVLAWALHLEVMAWLHHR